MGQPSWIARLAMSSAVYLGACTMAEAQTRPVAAEPSGGRIIAPAKVSLATLPVETLGPGVTRRVLHGTQATLSRWELKAGAKVPLHHHANEQMSWLVSGRARVTSGGREYTMEAGDVMVFPPNVEHAFEILEDTVAVEIFAPQRQDWIDQAAAGR